MSQRYADQICGTIHNFIGKLLLGWLPDKVSQVGTEKKSCCIFL